MKKFRDKPNVTIKKVYRKIKVTKMKKFVKIISQL